MVHGLGRGHQRKRAEGEQDLADDEQPLLPGSLLWQVQLKRRGEGEPASKLHSGVRHPAELPDDERGGGASRFLHLVVDGIGRARGVLLR